MNTKFAVFAGSAIIAAIASGCGNSGVTTTDLENARATARANSELNAELYRAANPRYTGDFQIISRSDSHQTLDCPQGDGFTDLNMLFIDPANPKNVTKIGLKCSTVSLSVGCYRAEDFFKMPEMVSQEGKCLTEYRLPLQPLSTKKK